MALTLENYMESKKMPETARNLLREQANHSVSFYGLNGEHLPNFFDKENLLGIIMGMQRLLIDTNSLGSLVEAKKPKNRNKAFILGETVKDEQANLGELLCGRNVDNTNDNLFDFGVVGPGALDVPVPLLMINRLDSHYRQIFDGKRLSEESRERAKRTDSEFLDREGERMEKVVGIKGCIHRILPSIVVEYPERKRSELIQIVRREAPSCFSNYAKGVEVAVLCYVALLLEQDEIGEKTRKEFDDSTRRNVFGDTRLIQNALWLGACIVSNDGAVKRMVEYLGLPEIAVTGKP